MATRVLVSDYPHRTLALATDDHVLVFRHTHSADNGQPPNSTSLPLPNVNRKPDVPRCMVEFTQRSSVDLSEYRTLTSGKGTLGLITLKNDVFICIVTGSIEAAVVRPGETIQKIYAVEFYCLNRSDYDHGSGHELNPYPGQTFTSDEFDYGSGYDQTDAYAEHPFHALKKLLSGGNFYYSVDFDLTRRLQDRADSDSSVDITSLDEGLLWNSYMIDPLLQFRGRLTNHERSALDNSRMLTSVIRGFAKTLTVPPSSSPVRRKVSHVPASITVISRLSSRRAGTRFNSRGIDDNGNVANFVETETIFWSPTGLCFSYTQVRGSVPIFWESSSSLIPGQQKIHTTRSPEATQPSFDKHFAGLEKIYGAIHIVNLLSATKPGEVELTERYRLHISRSPLHHPEPGDMEEHSLLRSTEFDFHERTRGATGYEGAKTIRPYIETSAESFVYFLTEEISEDTTVQGKPARYNRPVVIMQQNGVFRVNCLDCLDRTNLVQGMISQMALELFLSHRDERGNSDFWMRHSSLWADNGDVLSKIYAGTGALKSSFTRHGKMSLAGAFADARKSATRLYVNHFEDKGRQNTVDLLLGRLVGQSSVDLYDPINDWVVSELNKRRGDFESRATIKVFVGTYNLNGKTTGTDEDLSPWLNVRGEGYDIVAIGFQEIVELSPQQIMSTDPNRRMAWETAVRNCLNGTSSDNEKLDAATLEGDQYVLLRSGQLVGAALLVFVRSSILSRITNVEGAIKKTGMSGIAGNKGAVAIRMDIDSTSACFVTAHLAAGFGNYEERNRDYNTITSGLRFQRDRGIDDHEIIVWGGDFNYRIGLGLDKAKGLVNDILQANGRRGAVTADVQAEEEAALGKLYENDQLNIQMVAGQCFHFYREGRILFPPTYKFDIGKDEYDSSEKARIPAWCDRILWKVNQNTYMQGDDLTSKMKLTNYNSVMKMRFSDHRPVYATFEMGVRVVDEERKDAMTQKLYQKRAKEVAARTDDDGLLLDVEDSESEEEIANELLGYQSIQEGLPPASSDRKKWWLDGYKGASSTTGPPKEGMVLNFNRSANPWRDSPDEDWVQVDKPELGVKNGGKGVPISQGSSQSQSRKPEPPPPRGSTKRMIPPAWEGLRTMSQSSAVSKAALPADGTTASSAATKTPPPVPPHSQTPETNRSRAPSITSISSSPTNASSTISRKPPPKPAKPSSLISPSISNTTAGLPRVASLSLAESPETIAVQKIDGADDKPPPLPKRTNTAPITAAAPASPGTRSANINIPSTIQPRRVSTLLTKERQQESRSRDGSVSSIRSAQSTRSNEAAPPLPPRKTTTNTALMDEDVEMEMGWEALQPQ